jgi:SNF2 family DNA or RNA helicase
MSTIFHSNYYAHELTRRFSSEKFEKLSQSLFNATVDLNPHQIEAALFAFRSPLSRGAILADEVGLGKTIEAGLIISQLWAERKRRILIVLPAALREQWGRELLEKFFIASIILESKNFNQLIKQGGENPFEQADIIVLCSYHFARAKATDILKVPWDLVVVDEAHRLRNVYRKDNKIARTLLAAIGNRPKVLLTATPRQNSLMELYGLVSLSIRICLGVKTLSAPSMRVAPVR